MTEATKYLVIKGCRDIEISCCKDHDSVLSQWEDFHDSEEREEIGNGSCDFCKLYIGTEEITDKEIVIVNNAVR